MTSRYQRALGFPKPTKREAKPPKRIKRAKRPRKQRKTSRAKLGRVADALFARIVKRGGAAQCWEHTALGGRCAGALQCAHIVSRSYRSVRWDEENAMPLCAAAHVFYTHHALEWEGFVTMRMGEDAFVALKKRALVRWDGDIESVCVRLASRAVVLGIEAARPVPGQVKE